MPPSRRTSLADLDHALLLVRKLWNLPGVRRFLGERLDTTIEFDHYRALNALGRAGGGMSVGELARVLHVDSSTASRLVDRMEGRRYIYRAEDAEDRRRSTVNLSAAGWTALATLRSVRIEALGDITRDWRAVDIADLAALLTRLNETARQFYVEENEATHDG
ncbi:MarR family transcriptional regulator [Sphaerimonospora mesophila]|uniref:MarR family winged helix-turn-helix transcriptional regulator n=1 Tax=Sphaerimonospora mesophila TaxID=37483 RepID=UPI0006E3144A